jgi:hypothetical protein
MSTSQRAQLVALLSTFKEGPLAQAAVRSAQTIGCPVHVWEGQAGDDQLVDAPPTDLTPLTGFHWHHGNWRTDASKRTAMIRAMQTKYPGPLWAVWIDGDEVLVNAEYIPDLVQSIVWQDECDPQDTPRVGHPLRVVERDGRVSIARARLLRIDVIDKYVLSTSGIRFKSGVTMAEGNIPEDGRQWFADRAEAFRDGACFLPPPLPCEPFIMHRSWLRHPARAGSRLHVQEADELEKIRDAGTSSVAA